MKMTLSNTLRAPVSLACCLLLIILAAGCDKSKINQPPMNAPTANQENSSETQQPLSNANSIDQEGKGGAVIQLKSYENKDLGFSFSYPSNASLIEFGESENSLYSVSILQLEGEQVTLDGTISVFDKNLTNAGWLLGKQEITTDLSSEQTENIGGVRYYKYDCSGMFPAMCYLLESDKYYYEAAFHNVDYSIEEAAPSPYRDILASLRITGKN
ncbi:MAG TPA: hypothetical protein VMX18_03875 [Candidatus Bipolaricaulota bacterium]|nr:hypothetical protein [Candidatus Bipolaricaulota bacterium]